MDNWELKHPVVLIIFNRPGHTRKIFETIRSVKPPTLYVIADGPRTDHLEDVQKCAEARAVIDSVDWPCEIVRDYSEVNLGVGKRVSTGLCRVFEMSGEAIILEDDCLPDVTFFRFCSELLVKYRYHQNVMMIGGTNHLEKWKPNLQSYHFSYNGSTWGWASWQRAWRKYDYAMRLWNYPEGRTEVFDILDDKRKIEYWTTIFQRTSEHHIDTWDYQWTFARWLQRGISIIPAVNLISNIGFREDVTHTNKPHSLHANLSRYSMNFPLKDPAAMVVDKEFDHKDFNMTIGKPEISPVISLAFKHLYAHQNIPALFLLEKAINSKPDAPELHYGRAVALARLGHTEKARGILRHLLELRPQHRKAELLLDQLKD
jgi:tetratricopeptide (TPR) repeat protein